MDPKPPSTTSWDDSDFDGSEGFLPLPKSEPEHAESVPQPRVVQSAPPIPPPPHQKEKERGSFFWFVATGILVLVALLGFIAFKVMLPTTEDEAFYANDNESSVQAVTKPETKEVVETVPSSVQVDTLSTETTPQIPPSIEGSKNSISTPVKHTQPVHKEQELASKNNGAVYAVQVFSSPSMDDAKEWLQLLKSKNVSDGYIAEQYIKGDAWYRVRFGQFTSKSEAEAAAEQLGFQSSWIARLR